MWARRSLKAAICAILCLTPSYATVSVVSNPSKITHLWIITRDLDGEEGILTAPAEDGRMMPLMASDRERLDSMMPVAKYIAKQRNETLLLIELTNRVEVQKLEP